MGKGKTSPPFFLEKIRQTRVSISTGRGTVWGFQADFSFSVVLNEELERVGSGLVGIGLHNDIVMPYIAAYGTEEQKQRWIPGAIRGDLISAIAMTEPGAGSDLASIQTVAIRDGDHYILNGEKTFITNGYSADLVIVVAKTNLNANPPHKGISLFSWKREPPAFQRGKNRSTCERHK